MGLKEYQRKRDFEKTPEPSGKRNPRAHGKLTFIVQKHDASHLHYDFRLELDGVLKSWAVPKGPDLDPAQKRLAMQVEDHPIEYGGFEGVIPKGQYGGGTVMLWDRGVWEPVGDAAKGLREGHLKFTLRGEKLQGGWMLVRRGGRKAQPDERHWFLFKERDEFAKPGESITEEMPLSVTTGRDLSDIAEESDRVWGSAGEVEHDDRTGTELKAARAGSGRRKGAHKGETKIPSSRRTRGKLTPESARQKEGKVAPTNLPDLLKHPAARRAKLPASQLAELATLVEEAPTGDQWLHEIKFDGYRMLCRVDNGQTRFLSRNGKDWTDKFPELVEAVAALPVEQAMFDGEVVAPQADGTTSFQALQNVFRSGHTETLVYCVFDLLHLNGSDLTGVPLEDRKKILKALLPESSGGTVRYSDHLQGSGKEVIAQACHLHLEGIVSKRKDSLYVPGRGLDWLKTKCSSREEFVIGGFTAPTGRRSHFGALLMGYYNHDKRLVYAGRVGTGFDQQTLAALGKKLAGLKQARSAFSDLSGSTGEARGVSWVKPELVAEVEFSNWTDDRRLRHPSFQGLREDKPAREVTHDEPVPLSEVKAVTNGRKTTTHPSHEPKATVKRRSRAAETASDGAVDEFAGVHLSHPDKVLYPEQSITKRDLASYYSQVAEWMLPHIVGRPLALVRCPGGSGKPCFFQKHPGEGASEYLQTVNVAEKGAPDYNVAVDDLAGLISLVQMGVLEIHAWGSRARHLEKPDRLIFDLDPDPSVDWPQVVVAAREVRLMLEELGLTSFLKTTGGKGLHVVVPIQPRTEWDDAKAFCRSIAELMTRAAPDRYIATMSKAARKGKIFIDYLRNGRGATAIAPFSTRAKATATVSVPISWEELGPKLRSDQFTIASVPSRLKKLKKDPWADLATTKQSITAAMRKHLASL